MSFIGGIKVSADEFYTCWSKYDKDGNGFIEAAELDALLEDMVTRSGKEVNPTVLEEARSYYMGLLDENGDGKLDVNELAKLLVPEENFLLKFRINEKISSVDFMHIWRKYDSDKNGYIDKGELTNFIHDLLTRDQSERVVSVQKLEEYQTHILNRYDTNKDGRLEIKELVELLRLEENFLVKFQGLKGLTSKDFEEIFDHYDQDKSGSIEGAELEGLIKDCFERRSAEYDWNDLKDDVRKMMEVFDANKDGKLQKNELKMLLSDSEKPCTMAKTKE